MELEPLEQELLDAAQLGLDNVLSPAVWTTLLSADDRHALQSLLPPSCANDRLGTDNLVNRLLSSAPMLFDSRPVVEASEQLQRSNDAAGMVAARQARDSARALEARADLAARQHEVLLRCLDQRERLLTTTVQLCGEQSDETQWNASLSAAASRLRDHVKLQSAETKMEEFERRQVKRQLKDRMQQAAARKSQRLIGAIERRFAGSDDTDEFGGYLDEGGSADGAHPTDRWLHSRRRNVDDMAWLQQHLSRDGDAESDWNEVDDDDEEVDVDSELEDDLVGTSAVLRFAVAASDTHSPRSLARFRRPTRAAEATHDVSTDEYLAMLLAHRAKPAYLREKQLAALSSEVDFLGGRHATQRFKRRALSRNLAWSMAVAVPVSQSSQSTHAQSAAEIDGFTSLAPRLGFPTPWALSQSVLQRNTPPSAQSDERAAIDAPSSSATVPAKPLTKAPIDEDLFTMQFRRPFSSFFALLGHILRRLPEGRASLQRVQQLVGKWLTTSSAAGSAWVNDNPDWPALTESALRYLAGLSLQVTKCSVFTPCVDYKERLHKWSWLSQGQDDMSTLSQMCEAWMQTKDEDKRIEGSNDPASIPEPRCPTNSKYRKSTPEEQVEIRAQEKERYANPERPFTWRVRDYFASVGPIKGVFKKVAESASSKVRGHNFLSETRPSYVTVLTLIRDAAARLPNGEGTRLEVCETLRDSQYLIQDATDNQVYQMVSSALDRLRWEPDPCIRFDNDRKIWVYLHRGRTEEDFEKLHEMSAMRYNARKLQLQEGGEASSKSRSKASSSRKPPSSTQASGTSAVSASSAAGPATANASATASPRPADLPSVQ
ncbi:hypothetical protein CAOG_04264 [Capsaspora owczarzaki ATCC 30864]|uniref:Uncharacterized protein n=1 Tax=Capsaspora owczarzaki (strain ATCC 30864) TaxID=595528 RepID=A0A0D2VRI0_CAPO3|nr:hypothetical protein CAOG_04264 [Capsaspora owczarzaki ATCC 30864]KJE93477.1 hypothetical protein CAOG_004264 [Capsaspora owczarzaki ATCC 30864]|eukprot:XP_004348089.2 hypothetical protein CAOG_04264 [Capsaspora owczarzaki ATCC 30864]